MADKEENAFEVSQEVLAVFGALESQDTINRFIGNCPFEDGLEYVVAAAILKKKLVDLATFFGLTKQAAHTLQGWAMAQIIVNPLQEKENND